jgi:DNA (cytosine-5)-methyltransferase 1
MNELALFAGAGGGILGGKLLGWNTVCAVEWEQYPASVLVQRQNDKLLPPFPVWDDVRTFDGKPWRGIVDVVSGGFPCQDISPARTNSGGRGDGLNGSKSGLWTEFARIIGEVRPRWVLVENSHHLRTKGLGRVLKDLALIGYDAAWGVLSAEDCGANHERKRIWIVAHTNNSWKSACTINYETQRVSGVKGFYPETSNSHGTQCKGGRVSGRRDKEHPNPWVGGWWKDTSHLDGMDDGVAYRMDRLKAIGNGQVPIVAATAFKQLSRFLTCAHNDKMLLKEIEKL